MPGGGDPPEPPRIQRVCGSQIDTVAYCDRRGRFNFNLMRNAWSLTPTGAFGFGYFNSCGLRAYMPGFYSPMFSLANRGPYA